MQYVMRYVVLCTVSAYDIKIKIYFIHFAKIFLLCYHTDKILKYLKKNISNQMSNLKVDIFEDIKVSCRTILKETNLWDSDLIFWYLFCTFTNYKRNRQNIKIKTPSVPVSTRKDVFLTILNMK